MGKKALLIGINYMNTGMSLYGCLNDAILAKKFLDARGYVTKILLDAPNSAAKPTKAVILKEIDSFVSDAKNGDTLFFHFSGHGGQIADANGDERTGMDDTIYGCDLQTITDDELKSHLVVPLSGKNITLVVVLDCCHSGTGVDLSWTYRFSDEGFDTENNSNLDVGVVCISGCRDDQQSMDTVIKGQPQGTLTAFLFKVLEGLLPFNKTGNNDMECKWKDLIWILRYEVFTHGYKQIPQLSVSSKSMADRLVSL